MRKPSIGRIVHVVNKGFASQPAIVVAVLDDNVVNLQVFSDCLGGVKYRSHTPHERKASGDEIFWRWPPRVE